jgi:hypothetical protein
VVSSLAYPNLLGTKRLGCCCCCNSVIQHSDMANSDAELLASGNRI